MSRSENGGSYTEGSEHPSGLIRFPTSSVSANTGGGGGADDPLLCSYSEPPSPIAEEPPPRTLAGRAAAAWRRLLYRHEQRPRYRSGYLTLMWAGRRGVGVGGRTRLAVGRFVLSVCTPAPAAAVTHQRQCRHGQLRTRQSAVCVVRPVSLNSPARHTSAAMPADESAANTHACHHAARYPTRGCSRAARG